MKLKPTRLPPLVLFAGVLGFGLSLWYSLLGTDDRGLLPDTHPLLTLLYILIAGVILLLFLGTRSLTDTPAYKKLFPPSAPAFAGCIAAGIGTAVHVVFTLQKANSAFAVLACILGGLSTVSLVLVGLFRFKALRPHYLFHSIVTIYLIVQIISQYQSWNTMPQLQSYFFTLIAYIFLMLSNYHHAALDAECGKRRDFVFFNLGAGFFCCLAAAGSNWPFFLGMAVWSFTGLCSLKQKKQIPPMELPDPVIYCLETLENAGFDAYVVGGCVRDHLLGLQPADYDLCTGATPEQICELFARHELVHSGEKHGTVGVILTGKMYEITTFRTEGEYSDTRHPDWVEFVTDIRQDLARRDFTVNAIAFSPSAGFVDPFGGEKDLETKTLRAVGDAETRFQEDALRILRGIRFSVRFGFTPEDHTLAAMLRCAPLIDKLAKERISSELCKLLPLISQEDMLRYKAVFCRIVSELSLSDEQNQYARTAAVVGAVSRELPLRMAALLHTLDEETANRVLLRLRTSNSLRSQTLRLLQLNISPLPPDKKQLRQMLGEHGEATVQQLLCLQKAIAQTDGLDTTSLDTVDLLLNAIRQDGGCLTVKDLVITGSDLLALGVEPGPQIGRCMQSLLSLVQEDILPNTREELLSAAKDFFAL